VSLTSHPYSKCFRGVVNARHLGAVGGCGHHKRRQPSVDTDPPAYVGLIVYLMNVGGMQIGCLDIQ
jgi:hypothetical protein